MNPFSLFHHNHLQQAEKASKMLESLKSRLPPAKEVVLHLGSFGSHRQITFLFPEALRGDVDAMLEIGNYFYDQAVRVDEREYAKFVRDNEAIFWYRRAIRLGRQEAEFNLALILTRSKDKEERREAERIFGKMADAGIPEGQYMQAITRIFSFGRHRAEGFAAMNALAKKGYEGAVRFCAEHRCE